MNQTGYTNTLLRQMSREQKEHVYHQLLLKRASYEFAGWTYSRALADDVLAKLRKEVGRVERIEI